MAAILPRNSADGYTSGYSSQASSPRRKRSYTDDSDGYISTPSISQATSCSTSPGSSPTTSPLSSPLKKLSLKSPPKSEGGRGSQKGNIPGRRLAKELESLQALPFPAIVLPLVLPLDFSSSSSLKSAPVPDENPRDFVDEICVAVNKKTNLTEILRACGSDFLLRHEEAREFLDDDEEKTFLSLQVASFLEEQFVRAINASDHLQIRSLFEHAKENNFLFEQSFTQALTRASIDKKPDAKRLYDRFILAGKLTELLAAKDKAKFDAVALDPTTDANIRARAEVLCSQLGEKSPLDQFDALKISAVVEKYFLDGPSDVCYIPKRKYALARSLVIDSRAGQVYVLSQKNGLLQEDGAESKVTSSAVLADARIIPLARSVNITKGHTMKQCAKKVQSRQKQAQLEAQLNGDVRLVVTHKGRTNLPKISVFSDRYEGNLSHYCNHARVHTAPRLSYEQIEQVMAQITQKLTELHTLKFVHGDLNEKNIVITLREGIPYVKIIDFGYSYNGSADFPKSPIFETSYGCPKYTPPEFFKDPTGTKRTASTIEDGQKQDLYALGGILYSLLYGKETAWAQTVHQLIHKRFTHRDVLETEYKVLQNQCAQCTDPRQQALLQRCLILLNPDPAKRTL